MDTRAAISLGPAAKTGTQSSENEEIGVSPQKTKRKVKTEEHGRKESGEERARVEYFHDLETHAFRTEVNTELFPGNPTASC